MRCMSQFSSVRLQKTGGWVTYKKVKRDFLCTFSVHKRSFFYPFFKIEEDCSKVIHERFL